MDQTPPIYNSPRFYKQPQELTLADLDPLIGSAVMHINRCGWVWTMESCQGHPDAEKAVWANNTKPMLRVMCRHEDQGAMCYHLLEAVWWMMNKYPDYHFGPEIIPTGRGLTGEGDSKIVLAETLIYLNARTAYDRNIGIEVFEQFAGRLCGDRARASQKKEGEA